MTLRSATPVADQRVHHGKADEAAEVPVRGSMAITRRELARLAQQWIGDIDSGLH